MEFAIKVGDAHKQRCGCVVVGVFDKRKLSSAGQQLDDAADGYLSTLLRRGDIRGKLGEVQLLHGLPGVSADRVLLVGCGSHRDFGAKQYARIHAEAAKALRHTGSRDAVSYLTELAVDEHDTAWHCREAVVHLRHALYRYDQTKAIKKHARKPALKAVYLAIPDRGLQTVAEQAIAHGVAQANGSDLVRTLGDLPANICTPGYLAEKAQALGGRKKHVTVTVLDEKDMEKLGMGALLSVSRGSREPAKLITIEYRGADKDDKPVVLVGKGVTFDSGGISIKPALQMDEMKYDMCGAATVLGVMQTVIETQLPINVVGVIPSTENLPGGEATKPGDIVTSMSGQTIEILNTDAEGRLILCDALTYAARFNPDVVIDMATLTGAVLVGLGRVASAVLGNHQPLVDELLAAGTEAGDPAWQLPLWDEYQELLQSNFADLPNIGGRDAGTITAACFLSRFTGDYRWAHLDIAGTAWNTGGKTKGATGRPLALLMQYLRKRCA